MALELQSSTYQLNTAYGVGCSEAAVYKRLYHESVERCSILQEQVERSKGLFTKLRKIEKLKVHDVKWLKVRVSVHTHIHTHRR